MQVYPTETKAYGVADKHDAAQADDVLAQALHIPFIKTYPVRQDVDYGALQVFVPGKHGIQVDTNKVY